MPDTPIIDQATIRWEPKRAQPVPPWPQPPLPAALYRGLGARCPCCGTTRLFQGFLRVVPACTACSAPLGAVMADDAPPYFTIVVVAHVVVGLMLLTEQRLDPPVWVLTAVFVPMAGVLAVGLLRPIKGATVGLMLRLGLVREPGEPGVDGQGGGWQGGGG